MKDRVCDWIFKFSRYPKKLNGTENLVGINSLFIHERKRLVGFIIIFHEWKRAMLHKEIRIVSSFRIQLISESNNKKNPALLFINQALLVYMF